MFNKQHTMGMGVGGGVRMINKKDNLHFDNKIFDIR